MGGLEYRNDYNELLGILKIQAIREREREVCLWGEGVGFLAFAWILPLLLLITFSTR